MSATEKRLWTRLSPAESKMQLKTKGGVIDAQVVDVSFGGVAAVADRELRVNDGDTVDVCWRGSWMRGIVNYQEKCDDGYRVGIEWAKK